MPRDRAHTIKRLSHARLENLALRYVGHYAASRAMLERVLQNHYRRAARHQKDLNAREVKKWIDEIADSCVRKGWIDDKAYAQMVVNQAHKSGWSKYKTSQKLLAKGIAQDLIRALLEDSEDSEMEAALIFARRKFLGPYRKKKEFDIRKEMEKLCRAGFTPDIARKVVRMDQ